MKTYIVKRDLMKLLGSIIICFSAGMLGSLVTAVSLDTWYQNLKKPGFTPADSVFGPVWTVLYILMGISLYLVWKEHKIKHIRYAIYIFALQLVMNVGWSVAFFGFRSIVAGFIVIVFLWLAILGAIIKFGEISKTASLLLIPYLLWVGFAAVLNFSILMLNK